MQNYVYDTNFTRDVLTVGMTRCEKTYFTQKLAVNNFFGKIKRVEWVSYIDLDEEREAEVESCFFPDVDFHYPKLIEQLEGLLEFFKARSRTVKKMTITLRPTMSFLMRVMDLEKKTGG